MPLLHPLFALTPVPWTLPETPATALLLTSANAVRLAGPLPDALTRCPVFAVGEATAEAARAAGLAVTWTGGSDGAAALHALAGAGHRAAWHLRGRHARALPSLGVRVVPIVAYSADPTPRAPDWPSSAVALLHSPRAAGRLAELVAPAELAGRSLVAISAATARAAGEGWGSVEVAKRPTDAAMLALVAVRARPDGSALHR